MTTYVDTHCHLNFHQFDEDREEVVRRAHEAGVRVIVNPAIDLDTSQQALDMAHTFPGVFAQVGVHPNSAPEALGTGLETLHHLAQDDHVVAVGEIGLDYYWDEHPHDLQAHAFRAQLDMAATLGLPVVIHSRDAQEDTYRILAQWAREVENSHLPLNDRPFKGIWHSFQGDLDLAHRVFDLNMCLAFGGPVTFKNARDLHRLVSQLPLDRLVLETDAPFLSPHPYRGKRNEPARIPLIAQAIARLQRVPEEHVARVTTATAVALFGPALEPHTAE